MTLRDLEMDADEPSAARSQASSSAASPSDHPVAERTGSRRLVRQSLFYSSRSRHRRPSRHVEHPSALSSTEVEVTDQPTTEALSASDSAGFRSDHPGAEGAVSGTRIRQSVLYSNRPRRPRLRWPTEHVEHPNEESTGEHGLDLQTAEALSTSGPVAFSYESESDSDIEEFLRRHEPITFRIGSFGPETFPYSEPEPGPRFKWVEGIRERGQSTWEEINAAMTSAMLDPSRSELLSESDSDDDLRQGFDAIIAPQHAIHFELDANRGTAPPPPLPATQSSSAAAQPQHSTAPREPRCEASNAQLVENAENWMSEELKMLFEKYVETRDDLKGLDWCFNELCHQCFNVQSYHNIFHHYNFTVKMKKPNSVDWVVALYFAEVKQTFGRKYYFCCRLEPDEKGHCYACKSQDVEDLQHPATGGFDSGFPNVGFSLWYE